MPPLGTSHVAPFILCQSKADAMGPQTTSRPARISGRDSLRHSTVTGCQRDDLRTSVSQLAAVRTAISMATAVTLSALSSSMSNLRWWTLALRATEVRPVEKRVGCRHLRTHGEIKHKSCPTDYGLRHKD